MPSGLFVSYKRVSTARQGASGLGLEAQEKALADFLNGGDWKLIGEFVEVESGRNNRRPELEKALAMCRIHRATLVVSKLDRLARNAHFLLGLQEAGVDFVACDMPFATPLTVGIMAVVAQEEAKMISVRTRAALAAARARGKRLGSPRPMTESTRVLGRAASITARRSSQQRWLADIRPVVANALRKAGSARGAARELSMARVPARRGGEWTATQVRRVLLHTA